MATKNVNEALVHGGIDYTVSKRQAYFRDEDGEFQPTRQFYTVRDDIGYAFDTVSADYEVIQNADGVQFLYDLVDSDGLEIENVLMFGNGREIAVVTTVPEHVTIGVDEALTKMVWTNRHDGRGAGQGFGTNQIIVCKNTLEMAKHAAQFKYSIRHTRNAALRLEDAREAIKLNFKKIELYDEIAQNMLTQKMEKEEYNSFMRTLVGIEGKGKINKAKQETAFNNAVKAMRTIHEIRSTADYIRDYRTTKWGVMQAVTDYTSNRMKYRNERSRFKKLADGHPLTNRAFALLNA